jgi:hypothetical protein
LVVVVVIIRLGFVTVPCLYTLNYCLFSCVKFHLYLIPPTISIYLRFLKSSLPILCLPYYMVHANISFLVYLSWCAKS